MASLENPFATSAEMIAFQENRFGSWVQWKTARASPRRWHLEYMLIKLVMEVGEHRNPWRIIHEWISLPLERFFWRAHACKEAMQEPRSKLKEDGENEDLGGIWEWEISTRVERLATK